MTGDNTRLKTRTNDAEPHTFGVENARHEGCCVCNEWPHGRLCRRHRRALAEDLTSLRTGLYELQSVALREERVSSGGEGHANPAFASTPLDLSAQDLIDEAEDVLQQVASDCGVWAGGQWQRILRRLPARVSRVQTLRDYERIERISGKVRDRVTPPAERIVIGPCLTAKCDAILSIARGQKSVQCRVCGSVQAVSEVWQVHRDGLRKHATPMKPRTPSQAAKWLTNETHVPVSRQAVFMRLSRGMMPSSTFLGDGFYAFDRGDLLDLAEAILIHGVS
ncbi:MAG: hypothetical protein LKJ05_02725 [Bifidobacteriaceae bacterium]|nr:hypothetical protein [Bifidobacteriaceae bacterium]